MPKSIQYGGQTHVFPDDFTDADISAALSSESPAAGLQGADIKATPWWQKQVPLAQVLALGVKQPDAVADLSPKLSFDDLLQALPSIGGALGGIIGAGAGTGTLPGGGTLAGATGGAALGGGAGEAFRQLGRRAVGGYAPQSGGEAAKDIGVEAAKQGAAELAGGGVAVMAEGAGNRIMQSALKPNVSLLREYQTTPKELVQTLMDEGVNVTPGGMEKLQRLFDATNDELTGLIKNAPGAIDRKAVAARALPTAQRLSQQVNPRAALRDVGKVVDEFVTGPASFPSSPTLSVPEAQAMKVGTYRQIGKDYGKLSSASVETQKSLARGLREEIETAVPKAASLNAREANLLAAQDAVGHRVAIAGNRDPVGFAWTAAGSPKTFLAALFDRSPVVKSMVARGLYDSAGAISGVSPQAIRAAVAALASEGSDAAPAQE
jgi:hypothetical protein